MKTFHQFKLITPLCFAIVGVTINSAYSQTIDNVQIVAWGHNNRSDPFGPVYQNSTMSLPSIPGIRDVSNETFGAGASAFFLHTFVILTGSGLFPPSFSSYTFTANDDLFITHTRWAEHGLGQGRAVTDPDTNLRFVGHSYETEVRISSNGFTTSDLLSRQTVNQYLNPAPYTFAGNSVPNYRLSNGSTYEVRAFFLGPIAGSDPNIVWDDFGLQFNVIPEPSSLMLVGLCGISLLVRRRREGRTK